VRLTGASLPIASLACCDWRNLVGMTAGSGQNSDDFPIFSRILHPLWLPIRTASQSAATKTVNRGSERSPGTGWPDTSDMQSGPPIQAGDRLWGNHVRALPRTSPRASRSVGFSLHWRSLASRIGSCVHPRPFVRMKRFLRMRGRATDRPNHAGQLTFQNGLGSTAT
jgi:hypothetical protein